jgi:hypothetical protein
VALALHLRESSRLQPALLLTGRNGERLAEMRAELERPDREVDCVQGIWRASRIETS